MTSPLPADHVVYVAGSSTSPRLFGFGSEHLTVNHGQPAGQTSPVNNAGHEPGIDEGLCIFCWGRKYRMSYYVHYDITII